MRVLVVGGTGPTGPLIVQTLLADGHEVTILHTGLHEVDLGPDVEHIHADPHFADSFSEGLSSRIFDLGIAMYGRLRLVADHLRYHANYLIAIGGMFYDGWVDEVSPDGVTGRNLSYCGADVPTAESAPLGAPLGNTMALKALQAEAAVAAWNAEEPRSVMLRFPRVYGPRQPAPKEWCVVRRVRDGRRAMLVPDGGLLLMTRAYSENAAAFVIGAVRNLDAAVGDVFNVGDPVTLTLREWITMCVPSGAPPIELVSIPLEVSGLTLPYAKGPFTMGHKVLGLEKAERLVDLEQLAHPADALARTAEWYMEHPVDVADEHILGDLFDYEQEDRVLALAAAYRESLDALDTRSFKNTHNYRHPHRPSPTQA